MIAGADLHHSVDCPFRSFHLVSGFPGNRDVEIFKFVDDFGVPFGEAIVQPNCEIRPCLWGGFVFHDEAG